MTEQQPTPPAPQTHLPWRLIGALVLIAVLVVAGFQNTQSVDVKFLWFDGSWPLIWVLIVTVVVAIVASDLFRWSWRRRSAK